MKGPYCKQGTFYVNVKRPNQILAVCDGCGNQKTVSDVFDAFKNRKPWVFVAGSGNFCSSDCYDTWKVLQELSRL